MGPLGEDRPRAPARAPISPPLACTTESAAYVSARRDIGVLFRLRPIHGQRNCGGLMVNSARRCSLGPSLDERHAMGGYGAMRKKSTLPRRLLHQQFKVL